MISECLMADLAHHCAAVLVCHREDPEATITFSEFRTLAWEVGNATARQLGWIRSCNELHEAVKRAASAV